MIKRRSFANAALLLSTVSFLPVCYAQAPAPKSVLDVKGAPEKRVAPSSDQVTIAASLDAAAPGLVITAQPGKDAYPGVTITPVEGATWDLSSFGHVEARVTNLGASQLNLSLRVDDTGDWKDNPTNTETVSLAPGETGVVKTIFGYAYSYKPGHALQSASVPRMLIFIGKSDAVQTFRIESLSAGGAKGEKPPPDLAKIREKPKNGELLGGAAIDAAKQISAQNAQATLTGTGTGRSLRVVFAPSKEEQSVSLKPLVGRWDFSDYTHVMVKFRNEGKTPVMPRFRLETNAGPTNWVSLPTPLAPNTQAVLTIPFSRVPVVDIDNPETTKRVSSETTSGFTLAVDNAAEEQIVQVQSIKGLSPFAFLPTWLGKRPPVAGDWVQTLSEEFNGTTLNKSVWNNEGENWYDKESHWSKDNVLIGGGYARLRYQKKTGFNNDDPTKKQTDYAAGYLNSYGKWTQRYGYFECRLKMPGAPGLWPAFWMMPDRGPEAGKGVEEWKRGATEDGGMEFDIMEGLTGWGPHRYNVAQHWDGYGKNHQSTGTDAFYVATDQDGFLTAGLLWTPGSVVYYCNGSEVARWDNPRVSSVPSYFIFTLPQGGWDNNAVDDSKLPSDFVIDYVRTWQRKDLASPVDRNKPDLQAAKK